MKRDKGLVGVNCKDITLRIYIYNEKRLSFNFVFGAPASQFGCFYNLEFSDVICIFNFKCEISYNHCI